MFGNSQVDKGLIPNRIIALFWHKAVAINYDYWVVVSMLASHETSHHLFLVDACELS